MAGVTYKNVCLVCNMVLEETKMQEHLIINNRHVVVECMVNSEDPVAEIDINTSVAGVTDTWGDICHNIYINASDEEQKLRLVTVVNAGFITALKTKNFPLARGIALAFKDAGVITQADYDLIEREIPELVSE